MNFSKYLVIKFLVVIAFFSVLFNVNVASALKGEQSSSDTTGITGEMSPPTESNIFTLQNPLNKDISSVGDLIQAVIEILTYLFIIFAVLMFIYIGFQYVTNAAQGNAKKIEELHKQLMWLVIGVAVVIGARVIIQVVINTIAATNTVSPSVIDSANKAAKIK